MCLDLRFGYGHVPFHIWIQTRAHMHICQTRRMRLETECRDAGRLSATSVLLVMTGWNPEVPCGTSLCTEKTYAVARKLGNGWQLGALRPPLHPRGGGRVGWESPNICDRCDTKVPPCYLTQRAIEIKTSQSSHMDQRRKRWCHDQPGLRRLHLPGLQSSWPCPVAVSPRATARCSGGPAELAKVLLALTLLLARVPPVLAACCCLGPPQAPRRVTAATTVAQPQLPACELAANLCLPQPRTCGRGSTRFRAGPLVGGWPAGPTDSPTENAARAQRAGLWPQTVHLRGWPPS